MIVVSIMDIRERKVSTVLLAAGVLMAGAIAIGEMFQNQLRWEKAAREILLGVLPGGFLFTAAYLTKKAGYGDGVVLTALGILHGYLTSAVILCISLFLLSVFSIILLLFKRVQRDTHIPYLPFLTAAYMGCQFLGRG